MKIYTKAGDKGRTSLIKGKKFYKSDNIFDAIGSIDELNSHIGLIFCLIKLEKQKDWLMKIQEDLFAINSKLAGFQNRADLKKSLLFIEKHIDKMSRLLAIPSSFVFPGASRLEAFIHIARSVCRRAERQVVKVKLERKEEKAKYDMIVAYLNRLSDFLFVLASFANKQSGVKERLVSTKKFLLNKKENV